MSHSSGRLETAAGGMGPAFTVGGVGSGGTYNELQPTSKLTINIQGNFPTGSSIKLVNAAGSTVLGPYTVPQSQTGVTLSAGSYQFVLTGSAVGASAQIVVTG